MKDQLHHWNKAHEERQLQPHSQRQTAFAEEVNEAIPANASILELGCGEGNDSIYFAEQGHYVTATDFSDILIERNRRHLTNSRLTFEVQDISQPFGFEDHSFNAVYARLSLHYFSDQSTRKIFQEINRVLKPGGTLHFICKSTADSLYGQGAEIEPDMYELDGHIRHFFSEEYAKQLINEAHLELVHLSTGEENFYDRQSAFVKASATKKPL